MTVEIDTTVWRYILKHEEDYVLSVTGTGHDAAPSHFAFTKDRAHAKVFTYQDLYWKQAVNPIGIEFSRGFSRGEVIRVDNGAPPTQERWLLFHPESESHITVNSEAEFKEALEGEPLLVDVTGDETHEAAYRETSPTHPDHGHDLAPVTTVRSTETAYARSVRETSPNGALDPDLARFARELIDSKEPARDKLNTALAQLRAHKPVVGRSKLIVELCLKLGEE